MFKIGLPPFSVAEFCLLLNFRNDLAVIGRRGRLLDEFYDGDDFSPCVYERALHADRVDGSVGDEEHVAPTEQLFRVGHVKDGAGVVLRPDRKRDSGGDVHLDQASDDVR